MTKNKKILDACCGSKMFWFDKQNENTLYMDKRKETIILYDGREVNINPDVIADFRQMPFEDESFNLVVFDPPHLKYAGKKSFMKAKYGKLDKDNWPEGLKKGFDECMRVLKPNGTLVFKWSGAQINVSNLLKLIPYKPLFGNQRGNTHWMVFFKH